MVVVGRRRIKHKKSFKVLTNFQKNELAKKKSKLSTVLIFVCVFDYHRSLCLTFSFFKKSFINLLVTKSLIHSG